MADDLTLVANGREIGGWQSIRVTRGIERMPSDFSVKMTERWPGETLGYFDVIQAGDAAVIHLGNDPVLTGYVDRFVPTYSAQQHSIMVSGRSKCQDLVDCSAEWPGGQFANVTTHDLATKLATPYGISVILQTSDSYIVPQFNLCFGESAYEIIEYNCRYTALLAYDNPDGNLVLARAGTTQAASGFTEGVNVQQASMAYTMDQRFSDYQILRQSIDVLHDLGDGGNLIWSIKDPNVSRHRLKYIVSDGGVTTKDAAIQRVEWEALRRYGRSMALHIKTDGWRDSAGVLYTPNTLVPLSLPGMKVIDQLWLIGEVTYTRDEQGTTADLIIMPPSAFEPAPNFLPPFADITNPGPAK